MSNLDDWVDQALTKSLNTALRDEYDVRAYVFRDYHNEGETYVCVEVVCPTRSELLFGGDYPLFGTYISTILKDISEALGIEEPEINL